MTQHQDPGGGTLLEAPNSDEVQVIPQQPPPTKTTTRIVWLLAAVIAGALATLGVWAATQTRTADELGDTPRVQPDHEADWWIHAQLREQARAAQGQAPQLDPWIQGRLRDQDRGGQAVGGTGPALEQYAQSQHDSGTAATDRAAQHHERDDQRYLNQPGSDNASAAPTECRPAVRPVPC